VHEVRQAWRYGHPELERAAGQAAREAVAMSLSVEQRRALELLAGGPRGYTKARLLADGFTVYMLAGLVREGLATAQRETLRVGGQNIRVERYRISDAGRRALEG
jgi:hypothetical protein